MENVRIENLESGLLLSTTCPHCKGKGNLFAGGLRVGSIGPYVREDWVQCPSCQGSGTYKQLVPKAQVEEIRERQRLEAEKAVRQRLAAEGEHMRATALQNERNNREQQEKAEREKAEREKAEREKAEREKAEREKAEREKVEREKVEREKVERESQQVEREQRESDRPAAQIATVTTPLLQPKPQEQQQQQQPRQSTRRSNSQSNSGRSSIFQGTLNKITDLSTVFRRQPQVHSVNSSFADDYSKQRNCAYHSFYMVLFLVRVGIALGCWFYLDFHDGERFGTMSGALFGVHFISHLFLRKPLGKLLGGCTDKQRFLALLGIFLLDAAFVFAFFYVHARSIPFEINLYGALYTLFCFGVALNFATFVVIFALLCQCCCQCCPRNRFDDMYDFA